MCDTPGLPSSDEGIVENSFILPEVNIKSPAFQYRKGLIWNSQQYRRFIYYLSFCDKDFWYKETATDNKYGQLNEICVKEDDVNYRERFAMLFRYTFGEASYNRGACEASFASIKEKFSDRVLEDIELVQGKSIDIFKDVHAPEFQKCLDSINRACEAMIISCKDPANERFIDELRVYMESEGKLKPSDEFRKFVASVMSENVEDFQKIRYDLFALLDQKFHFVVHYLLKCNGQKAKDIDDYIPVPPDEETFSSAMQKKKGIVILSEEEKKKLEEQNAILERVKAKLRKSEIAQKPKLPTNSSTVKVKRSLSKNESTPAKKAAPGPKSSKLKLSTSFEEVELSTVTRSKSQNMRKKQKEESITQTAELINEDKVDKSETSLKIHEDNKLENCIDTNKQNLLTKTNGHRNSDSFQVNSSIQLKQPSLILEPVQNFTSIPHFPQNTQKNTETKQSMDYEMDDCKFDVKYGIIYYNSNITQQDLDFYQELLLDKFNQFKEHSYYQEYLSSIQNVNMEAVPFTNFEIQALLHFLYINKELRNILKEQLIATLTSMEFLKGRSEKSYNTFFRDILRRELVNIIANLNNPSDEKKAIYNILSNILEGII